MSALLLAAMLTTAEGTGAYQFDTASVSSTGTAKRLSVQRNATELLYIDSHGQLHLVRWCTPWDVAEAVLASGVGQEAKP